MKKSYIFIGIFLIFIIIITVVGSIIVTGNIKVSEDKDILLVQSNKEVYFKPYGYSIDNPNIVVNPYGNSPLTALVMFETDNYSAVSIKILSKDGNSDINYTFSKNKYHLIIRAKGNEYLYKTNQKIVNMFRMFKKNNCTAYR